MERKTGARNWSRISGVNWWRRFLLRSSRDFLSAQATYTEWHEITNATLIRLTYGLDFFMNIAFVSKITKKMKWPDSAYFSRYQDQLYRKAYSQTEPAPVRDTLYASISRNGIIIRVVAQVVHFHWPINTVGPTKTNKKSSNCWGSRWYYVIWNSRAACWWWLFQTWTFWRGACTKYDFNLFARWHRLTPMVQEVGMLRG